MWNDSKFMALSDDGKLAFIFALTHPNMTGVGAMRATIEGLAAELGWDPERLRKAFAEGFAKGMLKASWKACFLWFPKFLKYNKPESPNVVRSWGGQLDLIPECQEKNELLQQLKAFAEGLGEGFRKAFHELPNVDQNGPSFNQEQEQEQEQEQDSPPIVPPRGDLVVKNTNSVPYREIISDLNNVLNKPRGFTASEANKRLIRARWQEGHDLNAFRTVHRNMAYEWSGTDMAKYLRPATLYRASKFEGYLVRDPGEGEGKSERTRNNERVISRFIAERGVSDD
jgi:uncharacterized phage protein (TIGR02220 family)